MQRFQLVLIAVRRKLPPWSVFAKEKPETSCIDCNNAFFAKFNALRCYSLFTELNK